MDEAFVHRVTASTLVCLAGLLGYMAAGAAFWAIAPLSVVTAERARYDIALATGLPAADVPVDGPSAAASVQIGPFAYPYPPDSSWWGVLLGADDYGARGYSAEIVNDPGQVWSARDAEQRLRSAGWSTEATDDHGERGLTASSPEVEGAPSRVISLTTWQSSVRVDLQRAAPPGLHAALLGGAALGAALGLLVARARWHGKSLAGSPELSVIAAVSAGLGALAVGAFAVFSVAYNIPVWTSPFGAATVAPWAPLLTIGARQVFDFGLALLALAWLLPIVSHHRLRCTSIINGIRRRM